MGRKVEKRGGAANPCVDNGADVVRWMGGEIIWRRDGRRSCVSLSS